MCNTQAKHFYLHFHICQVSFCVAGVLHERMFDVCQTANDNGHKYIVGVCLVLLQSMFPFPLVWCMQLCLLSCVILCIYTLQILFMPKTHTYTFAHSYTVTNHVCCVF